ncbi:TraK domain-containing protein [Luteimonas sp. MHLX1A]|uniref:TraK domain-containing protein n=1 Tax=Alterluteimonas muca TaxID=2878684 RepID=UPI001E54EE8C|nr:type-F conjugative transfer system secretin TraK [Luteimonas sp. MHLX1A]MCD9046906.1 type-F conjugative transfer system secretin TraK [Luteimonas sp. MHLX1A]
MIVRLNVAFAALLLVGPAFAQVPGMPVRPVNAPVAADASAPTPAADHGTALMAATELRDQVLQGRDQIPDRVTASPSASASRPPPSVLRLASGRNEMVQVARGQPNRFLTPFDVPVVRFANELTAVDVEGRMVFVTTSSSRPVTLYVEDDANPDNTFVLTLLPREVPAVSITLHMEGLQPGRTASSSSLARAHETSDHFVAMLRDTFKTLAQGQVPSGYGLSQTANPREVPDCLMPGLRMNPAQTVTGVDVVVYVARLTNTSSIPQSVDEAACASDRVLAVAAWPYVELMPGQMTELYIAMRKSSAASGTVRPSLID